MPSRSRRPSHGGDGFPHQSAMESLFGQDFSGVHVATGEGSNLAAIGAGGLAGNETVALPGATPTLALMAHELAHIVQQRQSGPATDMNLTSAPGDSAEREAVAAEAKAVAGQPISISSAPTGALQGDWGTGALIGGAVGSLFGPVGAVAGGFVGGMIQEALSDDDEKQAPAAAPAKAPEPAKAEPAAAPATGKIKDRWADSEDIYQGRHKTPPKDQKLGALDTEESRLNLLNQFTQNTNKEADPGGTGDTRCPSTALLAAAVAGGGHEGLQAVLGQVRSGLSESDPQYEKLKAQLDAVEANMKGGAMNMGDLHQLNILLYHDLRERQTKFFAGQTDENGNPVVVPGEGVDPRVMQEFVQQNDTLKGYFADGKISIDSVDTDASGTEGATKDSDADHYVVHINTSQGDVIYDPFAHKDGNQVVRDVREIELYRRFEHHPDQIDGADFGGKGFQGAHD